MKHIDWGAAFVAGLVLYAVVMMFPAVLFVMKHWWPLLKRVWEM